MPAKETVQSGRTLIASIVLNIKAPVRAGIASKNENLAEFSLERPTVIPAEIVAPDLEIPGIRASAWKIPIKKAFARFMVLISFLFFEKYSAATNRRAVTKSILTAIFGLVKSFSMLSLKKNPAITTGKVATSKHTNNLSVSVETLNVFTNLKRLFRI